MWTDEQRKAAERLRELGHDRVASPYLVGVLLASTDPDTWPELVQAALVYRERFSADLDDSRQACTTSLNHLERCTSCAQTIAREFEL
jgi:hypothetical protein